LLLSNVQLSAAPLAGVWKVEDGGRRQLPGNARAAAPWSAKGVGWTQWPEGWGLSWCQQAVALWRVNRAQPTNRASGVSCTAWFGGRIFLSLAETLKRIYRIIVYVARRIN